MLSNDLVVIASAPQGLEGHDVLASELLRILCGYLELDLDGAVGSLRGEVDGLDLADRAGFLAVLVANEQLALHLVLLASFQAGVGHDVGDGAALFGQGLVFLLSAVSESGNGCFLFLFALAARNFFARGLVASRGAEQVLVALTTKLSG